MHKNAIKFELKLELAIGYSVLKKFDILVVVCARVCIYYQFSRFRVHQVRDPQITRAVSVFLNIEYASASIHEFIHGSCLLPSFVRREGEEGVENWSTLSSAN